MMMPGMFGNAGQEQAAATQELGQTIFKAGLSIYDKLNEAEIAVQAQKGQIILANSMNAFDAQIAQDPDTDTWQGKWAKAKDEAWKNAEGQIKNQGAKNALNEWWTTQSIEHGKSLEWKAIDKKARQVHETWATNGNAYEKALDKEGVKRNSESAYESGAITEDQMNDDIAKRSHNIDYHLVEKTAHAIAFDTQGGSHNLEAGVNLVWTDIVHGLSDEEKEKICTSLETQYNHVKAIAKEQETEKLGELANKWLPMVDDGSLKLGDIDAYPDSSMEAFQIKDTFRKLVEAHDKQVNEGSGMSVEKQDEMFRPFYEEFISKDFQNTPEKRNDLMDRAMKYANEHKVPIDGLIRLNTHVKYTFPPEVAAAVKAEATPPAGSKPEEKEVYAAAEVEARKYLSKHPEITANDAVAKVTKDIVDAKKLGFLGQKINSLQTGGKGILTKIFGDKTAKQNDEIGDLIQSGKMGELVGGEDTDATARLKEYEDNAAIMWKSDTGRTDLDGIVQNPPKRTYGKFNNLRPIVQLLVGGKKEIWELWMNPLTGDKPGEYHWDSIPISKYSHATDKDWTQVK
jgi:hypothetical protein